MAHAAAQVTFLALTRKAVSIRGPCFGGWLYRVAIHAAVKARDMAGHTLGPLAEDDPPAPEIDALLLRLLFALRVVLSSLSAYSLEMLPTGLIFAITRIVNLVSSLYELLLS